MRAGQMDQRVVISRLDRVPDGLGGATEVPVQICACAAHVVFETTRERREAGRITDPLRGEVRVRRAASTRQAAVNDRVVIAGASYRVISVTDRGRAIAEISLGVERVTT